MKENVCLCFLIELMKIIKFCRLLHLHSLTSVLFSSIEELKSSGTFFLERIFTSISVIYTQLLEIVSPYHGSISASVYVTVFVKLSLLGVHSVSM